MYQKKCEDNHVDLLLIGEREKHCFYHTLRRGRKHFCCYCLQAFRTAEKLKCNVKDCFKVNGKQTIKMPKKGKYIKFKNFGRKIKSPFTIYADFESILVPEDNGKQNPDESYTNK